MMSGGFNFPHINGPIFLWLAPHMMTLQSPSNLYTLPSPINMTTMINIRSFPLLVVPPGKFDQQAIHCPITNLGPLLRTDVTNPMLITVLDAYLTPKSPGTVSMVYKSVNLKEPYNQGIKEQVTTKNF